MKEITNFLLIFVMMLVGACMYIYSLGGNPFALAHQPSTLQGGSVVGPPTITAQRIDHILCESGSPACGTGQDMYDLGVQYGIDPAYCLAFFEHESTFGKYGEAAFTRNMGNLRSAPNEAFERDGYAAFYSWQESYRAWYVLISTYYVGQGLTTIPQIIHKYAPNSDNNDELAYTNAVESAVREWRQ